MKEKIGMTSRGSVLLLAIALMGISTPAARAHCPAPAETRPKEFVPHYSVITHAYGFAVKGCFPDGALASPTRGATASACNDRVEEIVSIVVFHISNPPVTPDERKEMKDLDARCQCSGSKQDWNHAMRHGYLKQKQERFTNKKFEFQAYVSYRNTSYWMDDLQLSVLERVPGQPQRVITVTEADLQSNGWRPSHWYCMPLSLKARLREWTASKGQTVGSVSLRMIEAGGGCLQSRGSLEFDGEPARST